MKLTEKQIENSILQFLEAKRILAWKNQTMGVWDAKKGIYRKPRNRYHRRGVPDILGLLPNGQFFAIEVKTPRGRLSDAQRQFIAQVKENGGIAFKASSIEEAAEGLNLSL